MYTFGGPCELSNEEKRLGPKDLETFGGGLVWKRREPLTATGGGGGGGGRPRLLDEGKTGFGFRLLGFGFWGLEGLEGLVKFRGLGLG